MFKAGLWLGLWPGVWPICGPLLQVCAAYVWDDHAVMLSKC